MLLLLLLLLLVVVVVVMRISAAAAASEPVAAGARLNATHCRATSRRLPETASVMVACCTASDVAYRARTDSNVAARRQRTQWFHGCKWTARGWVERPT